MEIPNLSLVIMEIVCSPTARGLLGLYVQVPFLSAFTSVSREFLELIIIFKLAPGEAVPLKRGCKSVNASSSFGVRILGSFIFSLALSEGNPILPEEEAEGVLGVVKS